MANYILIGYSASGKTTVGKLLARKIGYKYVSTDKLVESKAGIDTAEIIKTKGKDHFSSLESEALEDLASKDNLVIDVGSGGPIRNPEAVKNLGKVIFLKTGIRDIEQRTLGVSYKKKYLREVRGVDESRYSEYIEKRLKEREPVYARLADLTVDTTGIGVKQIVDRILTRFRQDGRIIKGTVTDRGGHTQFSSYIDAIGRFRWLIIALLLLTVANEILFCESLTCAFRLPYEISNSSLVYGIQSVFGYVILLALIAAGWFSVKHYKLKSNNELISLGFLWLLVAVSMPRFLNGFVKALGDLLQSGISSYSVTFLADILKTIVPVAIPAAALIYVAYTFAKGKEYGRLGEFALPAATAYLLVGLISDLLSLLPPPFAVIEKENGVLLDGIAYFLSDPLANIFAYGPEVKFSLLFETSIVYGLPLLLNLVVFIAAVALLYMWLYKKMNKKPVTKEIIHSVWTLYIPLLATGMASILFGSAWLMIPFAFGFWIARKIK